MDALVTVQRGLVHLERFMETRHNYIPFMGWERSFSGVIGLSLDQTRFMLALIASIPAGYAVRGLRSSFVRHLYSAVIGFLLVYYPFGFGVIHAVAPSVLVYLAAMLMPSACGTLAWLICFPYLIYLHVVNASGENWQMGLLDFTGCEMVLVLKLITFAVARQDYWMSKKRGRELSEYQSMVAVDKTPDPLRYLSYVFGLGNLLAGPQIEYVDYRDFMEHRGLWGPAGSGSSQKLPAPKSESEIQPASEAPPVSRKTGGGFDASPFLPALKYFLTACFWMAVYQALIPTFNRSLMLGSWYKEQGFMTKVICCFFMSFTCQVKFVFAWKISEASLTMAGLNLAGWDENGNAVWGRYENVRFVTMLMSDSARLVVSHWNIGTARFLRRYVYERLTPKGKRPGFAQLLVTQLVSAIWHGLYPGYLLFFAASAFWLNFATVIHKAELALLPAAVASSLPVWAIKVVWTHLCLNAIATSFMLLELKESLAGWASLYYVPMIIIVGGSVLGPMLIPRPRKPRSSPASVAAPAAPKS